ncbi:MAG TPA: lipid II flippase MurJ [Candidatus Saccharimonadales bacterium]
MGRVRSVVARANQKVTVQIAALLLSGATLISFVFGFIRLRLLNAEYFDTYPEGLAAYVAAFKVPDFMFFMLVSGALSVTFIPVFNQRLAGGNKKSAWELSSSMMNLMAGATFIASVLIIIFAEPIIHLIAPGLGESTMALAVSMMRVIAVNPFLFAIATVIASIQQAVGRFAFFTLAPIIYNIGIVIGIVWFTDGINIFGWQVFEGGIMGVALGVAFGSVLQLLVSAIGLIGLGFDYRFKIYWKNKGFREVLRLLPARSLDQGMDYLVGMAETNIASRFKPVVLTAYDQAMTLHMAPINLIGVAISTAAFPRMTERLSAGRTDLFRKELQEMIRIIIWLALPVAMVTFATRGLIVSFIKNGGVQLIADLLGLLVIAILFRSVYYISARSFYAQQDTKTPLYISIFSIGLNIGLAIWLGLTLNMGAYGLAWAQSIASVIEVAILFFVMSRRIPGLFGGHFWKALGRMVIAGVLTGIVSYILTKLFPFTIEDDSIVRTLPKFVMIASFSLLAYVGFSWLLRIREANPVIVTMKKLLFGKLNVFKKR